MRANDQSFLSSKFDEQHFMKRLIKLSNQRRILQKLLSICSIPCTVQTCYELTNFIRRLRHMHMLPPLLEKVEQTPMSRELHKQELFYKVLMRPQLLKGTIRDIISQQFSISRILRSAASWFYPCKNGLRHCSQKFVNKVVTIQPKYIIQSVNIKLLQ